MTPVSAIINPKLSLYDWPWTFILKSSQKRGSNHDLETHCKNLKSLFFEQRPRRGWSPVEHRGKLSIRRYVHPSIHSSPLPHPQSFVSFGAQIQTVWPKSKQYGPNPNKMAQIQAKWPKSRLNGLNPYKMGQIWLKNLNSGLSSIILAP